MQKKELKSRGAAQNTHIHTQTHTSTRRMHSLFFTHALFLLSLSSSFSASEKSWHRLGLGDVLRPLITLCQLCYTLVGVRLSFPICFCSHYLAPGQAPCLKYTHALVHTRAHTHTHMYSSSIFVLMTQFYNCVKPTHGIAGVFFIFTSLFFLERTGEIKRKCWPLESQGW